MGTIGCRLRMRLHFRRVAPHFALRQGKGRDFSRGNTREKTALLLVGPEENDRLRNADRLMSREQGGQIAAITSEEHRGATIIRLGKAKSAIIRRDFDAERSEFREALKHSLRNLTGPIDLIGIDVLPQVAGESFKKGVA